jgi:hypothetical protein
MNGQSSLMIRGDSGLGLHLALTILAGQRGPNCAFPSGGFEELHSVMRIEPLVRDRYGMTTHGVQ